MKSKFTVIGVPAKGKQDWWGGAFTLTFVYAPHGNFLVKGYKREVDDYIESHFKRYFLRSVLYRHGEHRTIFRFSDECQLFVSEPKLSIHDYSTRFKVMPRSYHTNKDSIMLKFKRFPTKWIPEFDYLIDKYQKKDRSYNGDSFKKVNF